MALTHTAIKQAKPKPKQYKLYDEKGLYVLVHANGRKYWRFKYKQGMKEKTLALGVFPEIGLTEARDLRDDARKQLANDLDHHSSAKNKKSNRQKQTILKQ